MHNYIVIDHAEGKVIDKISGFDLSNPKQPPPPASPKTKLVDGFTKVMATQKLVTAELKLACCAYYIDAIKIEPVKIVAAVRQTIEKK